MGYIVKAYAAKKINLAPETTVEEVLQNVATIISTPKYTVPLDRGFGLSQRFVDMPMPTAQAILVSEVFDAIEKYEPRAEVVEVTFEQDDATPGKLIPRVEVNIIGDNE